MSDEMVQTHSTGCHMFGHRHYDCALREIERLRAEVATAKDKLAVADSALAALRKRIDEAPTIGAESLASLVNATLAEQFRGKRVALFVLGEG